MALSPQDQAKQQWDYLVTTLTAEMQPSKRIPTCKDVRHTLSLWTEFVPAIGVQLMDVLEQQHSTQRHIMQCNFVVQVSCQSTPTSATAAGYAKPNLDDAMAQLQALVSDGSGNGVCAILRDPANRTLGGNAGFSRITAVHYQPDVQPGSDINNEPEIWAHAFIDFQTVSQVAIN